MTTQPEALRLAQHINDLFVSQWGMNNPMAKDSKIVLDELRRLHESNQELLGALETLRYAYASHGNHAYCQVGTEEDLLKHVEAAIAKAERTTT